MGAGADSPRTTQAVAFFGHQNSQPAKDLSRHLCAGWPEVRSGALTLDHRCEEEDILSLFHPTDPPTDFSPPGPSRPTGLRSEYPPLSSFLHHYSMNGCNRAFGQWEFTSEKAEEELDLLSRGNPEAAGNPKLVDAPAQVLIPKSERIDEAGHLDRADLSRQGLEMRKRRKAKCLGEVQVTIQLGPGPEDAVPREDRPFVG